MDDAQWLELAQAAGISTAWTDYLGVTHQVDMGTLRQILDAQGIAPTSSAQARDAHVRLQEAQSAASIIVARAGEPIAVPIALFERALSPRVLRVRQADGSDRDIKPHIANDGQIWLNGLDQPGYHSLLLADGEVPLALAPGAREAGQFGARAWALAVQLYSLRRAGSGGIGDYTALAELAQEAAAAGAGGLAISPVHALFSADVHRFSPYAPSSRLFYNAMHIDVSKATDAATLQRLIGELNLGAELAQLDSTELVDWPRAGRAKLALLRATWKKFSEQGSHSAAARAFAEFRAQGGSALENHARFEMLQALQLERDSTCWHWRTWPAALRNPGSPEVGALARQHADTVGFHIYLQWLADQGLAAAQAAARAAGMKIGLIADLAVGTDSGGSHGWGHQRDMLNGLSIGAPPDLINSHGQSWGLTTFSPQGLRRRSYAPFLDMVRSALRHAGGMRVDHILGLQRLWVVPEGQDAANGAYLSYPFDNLANLIALEAWQHQALIVGEDLGTVPAGFRHALADAGLLGMEVLWFQRDNGFFVHPSRWSKTAIATTSTHDLPPVAGWWSERDIDHRANLQRLAPGSDEASERAERSRDRTTLWNAFVHAGSATGGVPTAEDTSPVVDAALHFTALSPSPLMVVPMEDLVGAIEQPNLPGTIDEHPNWRRRLSDAGDVLLQQPQILKRLEILRSVRPGSE